MTTSDSLTASVVRTFGISADMSMPSSAMASTAAGLTCSAGWEPADRTSIAPLESVVRKAAAICERPALWTQTNRTEGFLAVSVLTGFLLEVLGGLGGKGAGGEVAFAGPEGHVNQCNKDGDFDQGPDDAGQGLPGGDAEGADRHRNGEFEVVARRRERQRGGLRIAQVQPLADQHAGAENDQEIDQQGQRDPGHVQWTGRDGSALQGEEQGDGEQQAVERPRAKSWQELPLVPVAALGLFADGPREETCEQRDAEEHQHGGGDGPEREVGAGGRQAEPGWQDLQVEPAQRAERDDLEDGVDGHQ